MKKRYTISSADLRPGDVIIENHGQVPVAHTVRIEREVPDVPTQVGSIISAVTATGAEVLARVAIGDGAGRNEKKWVSLSDQERLNIWRHDTDIQEYTPLVLHKEVSYGDIRDAFYDHCTSGQAPSNALVEALHNLANKGAR